MSSFYKPDDPAQKPGHDSDKITFLNLAMKPGKVDYVRAGYILDMQPSAIRTLVSLGVLKPLGKNGKTEHKYFSTPTIVRYAGMTKNGWIRPCACSKIIGRIRIRSVNQPAAKKTRNAVPAPLGWEMAGNDNAFLFRLKKAKKEVPRPPPDQRAM